MEQRAITSMVGRPETKERLFRTIQASNNGGSVSPNGTIEDIEELELRGLKLNTKIYEQKILSHSKPNSEYSNSSELNLWQQGDTFNDNNNRGSVRAVWRKYKNIQFKRTNKIKKVINFTLMKKTIKSERVTTQETTSSTSTEKSLPISTVDEIEQLLLEDPNLCLDYGDSLCTS